MIEVFNIYHENDYIDDDKVPGAYRGASDWNSEKAASAYILEHNLAGAEVIDSTESHNEMNDLIQYEIDREAGRDCNWYQP